MYIPSFNKFEDRQQVIAFMQRYSFATVITVIDDVPVATHLPVIVKEQGDKVVLRSHFAKANPQAKASIDKDVLVIFTEPHAYISPKNYEKEENVPTWNYLAVHAYGKCAMLEGEDKKADLLQETIKFYDAAYLKQWEHLSEKYKSGMMNGITAFEIEVTNLQAKAKLSQNRTELERHNIVTDLDQSPNSTEKELAEYIKRMEKP